MDNEQPTPEDVPFTDRRVVIAGLGLMGGSLALALKGRCGKLYGIDVDPDVAMRAVDTGVVDRAATSPAELFPEADVIILATPVGAILELIRKLPEYHPGRALVLDLGSTKWRVLQAMETLPPRFDAVGGHPMCGKESSGLENASSELFRGAVFAFTPLERTSAGARDDCNRLAGIVGARALWLDARTHDRWTAASSHLPYIVANCLAGATPPEARPLIGPGFRSTTRLAVSSTRMMRDILATNTGNVLESLARFKQCLDEMESLLRNDDFEALEERLEMGASRQKLLT